MAWLFRSLAVALTTFRRHGTNTVCSYCSRAFHHPPHLWSATQPLPPRVISILFEDRSRGGMALNGNTKTDNVDPFAVFEQDSDEDNGVDESDEGRITTNIATTGTRQQREAHNGVLAFHMGTEQILLLFVQQQMSIKSAAASKALSQAQKTAIVLDAVDQFCFERHWMMHVGPQKGKILQDFLQERFAKQQQQQLIDHAVSSPASPFVVVELGTYCGYSTIRMIDTSIRHMRKLDASAMARDDAANDAFHIFTVDVDAQTQGIARQLVEAAGLSQYVTFVLLSTHTKVANQLTQRLTTAFQESGHALDGLDAVSGTVDFLFVDHDKNLYLADVQQLEATGWIRAGTAVAADNVVFFQLAEYRKHMAQLQAAGHVTTQLVSDGIVLEYVESTRETVQHSGNAKPSKVSADDGLKDGLELTVYLNDPPRRRPR